MSIRIEISSKLLKSKIFPLNLSCRIWHTLCRAKHGEKFFFPLSIFGKKMIYGGICGLSNYALFTDLENYEPETIPAVASILLKNYNPVIIDVGANNGQWIMLFKSLNVNASIHCFEPFPELSDFICELVKRNSFKNVHISSKLVGETAGIGKLHFADQSTDTASTVSDFQPNYNKTICVEKITIDDYVEEQKIERIHLIKIDVEGGELEVVKGARRVLEEMHPDLLLELLYTEDKSHLYRQNKVVELLKSLGYYFYHIQHRGVVNHQEIVSPDPTYTYLNYLVSTSTLTSYMTYNYNLSSLK